MLTSQFPKRVLDNLSTAVFVLDSDLRVSYFNPAAEMLVQMGHKRINNRLFERLFAEIDPHLLAELGAILDTGHTYTQRECSCILTSGTRVQVDCTVSRPELGKKGALLIEMQETDRLMRISREEQLHENQETAKILIRGLAHEIKNPLGGIRGAAQLLDAELTNDDHHEYTSIIIEESDRLRNLVDRMLGTNKALNLVEINIHEILERVCTLIRAESGENITLVKDYDPSIPELKGDKGQLIQAFLNIAKNALQALSPQMEQGENATITLRTRALRQFTIGQQRHRLVAKVEIIDNGPGIPKEFLQSIFYPMISGRAEGTGLGLSITQSIFSKHDGLVECESSPGSTNFIVYLPLETSA
ncbi:MAG: nitrogen regulation protein NR(II) [Oleiphilaceae bacterium]|nr:nitrogen regulation protein NR(II) [Oleiphilaceae bacterium]